MFKHFTKGLIILILFAPVNSAFCKEYLVTEYGAVGFFLTCTHGQTTISSGIVIDSFALTNSSGMLSKIKSAPTIWRV